eukprot:GFUD01013244.1.p1 GENE.GFUD01013244.1~~GFUD01013244.1.p1  ORF type:complete len:679 (-),score=176.64 GFUD01013244.1:244-2280(-)
MDSEIKKKLMKKLAEIGDNSDDEDTFAKPLSVSQESTRTSTRTRDRLIEAERQLAMRGEPSKTSTRTREKLEAANTELAKYQSGLSTSTRTREKLADAERKLAANSTRTRERLRSANEQLAEIKTTTRTRKELDNVEKAIKTARKKETSSYTLEVFKKKQELLANLLDQNKHADVAFLVDCTGSMAGYIKQTKDDINKIVSKVTEMFDNKLRVAFVGYRDHSDGFMRIETLGFTENIEEFQTFVNNIAATGGADAPEDVLGGLEAVINLAWSSASKVVFHVGDAPQHGEQFHDFGSNGDSYYSVEPSGLHVEDLFKNMKQIGLKYFFGKINNSTDKMFKVFQELGGTEMVKAVDMSNPNLLETRALASITATIEGTLSFTVDFARTMRVHGTNLSALSEVSDGGKTLKDYSISDAEPDDAELTPLEKVHWLTCLIGKLDNIREIKHHIGTINHRWSAKMVKKAKQPFSEGAQRISYHGQKMNYADGGRNEKIVLKEFKHFGSGRDRRTDYIEIMETQCVAAFLAMEFNKLAPTGSKKINFIVVSVAQVFDESGTPNYYNVEPLLPEYAKFKKWNTNFGAVNIDEQLIQAFSHWTYDITGGFLVVVDLQGIERSNEYGLTDPCINCKEPRFGSTNMGEVGIQEFFRTHKCNSVCKTMGLKEITLLRKAEKVVKQILWKV